MSRKCCRIPLALYRWNCRSRVLKCITVPLERGVQLGAQAGYPREFEKIAASRARLGSISLHLKWRRRPEGQGYVWRSATRFLPDREVRISDALHDWVEFSRRGQGCKACCCNSTTILHVPLHLHNTARLPSRLFLDTSHCPLLYAFSLVCVIGLPGPHPSSSSASTLLFSHLTLVTYVMHCCYC
jgi:hypothetical protein